MSRQSVVFHYTECRVDTAQVMIAILFHEILKIRGVGSKLKVEGFFLPHPIFLQCPSSLGGARYNTPVGYSDIIVAIMSPIIK